MTNNLEYYKVFYFVAKSQSLTEAARQLAISQPAVSQSIRQLEQQVGTRLFQRMAKGVKLTQEGQVLFSYVEKGYEQIEMGEKKLHQMLNLDSGEIRIGASDMTLQFYLLPYLERFHETYPNIKVNVTNGPTPETIRYLQNGRIDFGIVSTPFTLEGSLRSMVVKEIEDVFVAGRRFTQYKNRTLDLDQLQNMPLILLEKNTSTRSYMDQFLNQSQVDINPEFELANSDMIVQFALRNLGVGCVVREFASQQLENGKLFELRFNKKIPRRSFCVITDEASVLSAAARNLLELIKKDAAGQQEYT